MLDDAGTDARDHLRHRGAQLTERIARLQETVSAVDRLMEAPATGMRLSPEEQIAIFGDDGRPS
ncbi:hypothetical protein ACLQ2P_06635 [Actinomadura citrea]|uniref:hypothetical protein n=1 Tax=Actinomadura citrea TaxID=46158 RepID=UPI003CE49597